MHQPRPPLAGERLPGPDDVPGRSGPPVHGRIELPSCTVRGCRYGNNSLGLCMRHYGSWVRSGRPDPAAWAADRPAVPEENHAQCRLPFCTLWTEHSRHLFCHSHQNRWHQLGSPEVDDFIDHCLRRGKVRIDFSGLTPQLKLEVQYAVQCRYDQQRFTAPPPVVNWAIRIAANAGVPACSTTTRIAGEKSPQARPPTPIRAS